MGAAGLVLQLAGWFGDTHKCMSPRVVLWITSRIVQTKTAATGLSAIAAVLFIDPSSDRFAATFSRKGRRKRSY